MTGFLKGIFFKVYKWSKWQDLDTTPEYSSISFLSVLLTFNIITIVMYIRYFFGLPSIDIPILPPVMVVLVLMGLMYLGFIRKGKHVKIYKEYSNSIWNKGTGSFIVIAYMLLSILFFVSLIWVNHK